MVLKHLLPLSLPYLNLTVKVCRLMANRVTMPLITISVITSLTVWNMLQKRELRVELSSVHTLWQILNWSVSLVVDPMLKYLWLNCEKLEGSTPWKWSRKNWSLMMRYLDSTSQYYFITLDSIEFQLLQICSLDITTLWYRILVYSCDNIWRL